jgi:hypothetical protein
MMLPQQTPYTTPPKEVRPEVQPPVAQRQIGPEYNDQFIETPAHAGNHVQLALSRA